MSEPTPITLADLRQIFTGGASAIRCVTKLLPSGGEQDKVFPPTYEGGEYAVETRINPFAAREEGKPVPTATTVVLNSVQSEANFFEAALQAAYKNGRLKMPMIEVTFKTNEKGEEEPRDIIRALPNISALQAPHRAADAILRDSLCGDVLFLLSQPGQECRESSPANATGLFTHCPVVLLFGVWFSTDIPKRTGGSKLARALVSEIVAWMVEKGKRSGSRIDPLEISGVVIYKDRNNAKDWTPDESQAETVKGSTDKFVKFGQGKPSEVNHGNILPSLHLSPTDLQSAQKKARAREKEEGIKHPVDDFLPGGYTMEFALQTTVLSIPGLRRLQFPIVKDGETLRSKEIDLAAQVILAALALCAIALRYEDGQGYDLRSRCSLNPSENAVPVFEVVRPGPSTEKFTVSGDQALNILTEAVEVGKALGLPWNVDPLVLTASDRLRQLIYLSRTKADAPTVDEAVIGG